MDRINQHSLVVQLQRSFVEWTAEVAADDLSATVAYMQVLSGLPEGQGHLRGVMVTALSRLMRTAQGLNAALPPLYSAMVGASQQLRAAAVDSLGTLDSVRSQDLPRLLYEAFVASLADPFVIVHQAAVRALERLTIPEEIKPVVKQGILQLILAYSHQRDDDEFLIKCIALYAARYATAPELHGDIGAFLVSQMAKMKADLVIREIGWFGRKLMMAAGFGTMAIGLLKAADSDDLEDRVVRVLRDIGSGIVYAERKNLESIAVQRTDDSDLVSTVVELLTGASAWEEATQVASAAFDAIADTTRNRPLRLNANLLRIATTFEMAIAGGAVERIGQLAQEWRTTVTGIEQDRKEHGARRNPLRGFPRSH